MRHVKWVVVLLGFVAVALGVGAVRGSSSAESTRSGCWSR
mgnify:CR=1 FL=1